MALRQRRRAAAAAALSRPLRPFRRCCPPLRPSSTANLLPEAPPISAPQLEQLRGFLEAHPRLCVLTGAGLSTESGIPDYRSPNGSYSKGHKPITWQEFSRRERHRQRYWARSMAGWRFMEQRQPNAAHRAVAQLEEMGRVELLITQNVDRLHHQAGSEAVCELHGGAPPLPQPPACRR